MLHQQLVRDLRGESHGVHVATLQPDGPLRGRGEWAAFYTVLHHAWSSACLPVVKGGPPTHPPSCWPAPLQQRCPCGPRRPAGCTEGGSAPCPGLAGPAPAANDPPSEPHLPATAGVGVWGGWGWAHHYSSTHLDPDCFQLVVHLQLLFKHSLHHMRRRTYIRVYICTAVAGSTVCGVREVLTIITSPHPLR